MAMDANFGYLRSFQPITPPGISVPVATYIFTLSAKQHLYKRNRRNKYGFTHTLLSRILKLI